MTRKRTKSAADIEAAALAPLSLLVVDEFPGMAPLVARKYRDHTGAPRSVGIICATNKDDLFEKLYKPPGKAAGRPPLRGAMIDLFLAGGFTLHGETAFEVIDFLEDDRYPLLPICTFTGADADFVECLCRMRGATLVRPETARPRQLHEVPNDAIAEALIGVICRPAQRAIPVFSKNDVLEKPEVLRYLEREVFAPWDAFCRAARKFGIEEAAYRVHNFSEHVFRTLDALVEGIEDHRIGHARGLSGDRSGGQERYLLGRAVGPIAQFLRRWQRRWRTTRVDPLRGDRWAPVDERPPPRPSARRSPG